MTLKLFIINFLTLIRVIGTIILVPIYNNFGGFSAGILSLVCYLTDSIDGILARHFKASTFFGALFDGTADKLFTIVNFIVLYLITPYALIPIIFELLIVLVQFIKYRRNLNIKSNIIGKFKVWILAMSVVATFFISDMNRLTFLPLGIKEMIEKVPTTSLYFYLLLPAIIMEALTLLSYLMEIFTPQNIDILVEDKKEEPIKFTGKNKWENFKSVWLNPEYYLQHKDDSHLKKLTKLSKK